MLMLEVVSPHKASMGRNARRVISDSEAAEFTIGRQEGCSWVFPQDYVSRQQAVIRVVNGMYFLERKGSAPLAINDRSRPVERNRIVRLSPGDRILIDDLEILVSEVDADIPADLPEMSASLPPAPPLDWDQPQAGSGRGGAGDILDLIGGNPQPTMDSDRHQDQRRKEESVPGISSVLNAVVNFQDVAATAKSAAPAEVADDRWWEDAGGAKPVVPDPGARARTAAMASPPATPPPLVRRPSPPRPPPPKMTAPFSPPKAPAPIPGTVSLDDVLRGAGLDPAQVKMSPDVARQLGEVLRIVVAGTMDVLKARNDIRRELRLASTVLAATENNPLKFSADVDDALHKLLIQQAAAYLGTVAAFREAFSDIRRHQVALLKSVGAAFDHMLAKFDPKSLEKQLAAAPVRAGVLGLGAKPKPWEAYSKLYQELVDDRDASYRRLFGEEWARAYEKELELQKRIAKAGEGAP